jgi:hypothetical protein
MTLSCSDATSLFELAFGINAVIAVLSESKEDGKRRFLSGYIDALVTHTPSLSRQSLDKEKVTELLFGGFPNIRRLIAAADWLRVLAFSILIASAGTLLQAAQWGKSCELEPLTLNLFVFLSLFVAPAIYWSYAKYLKFVVAEATVRTVPKMTKFTAAILVHQQTMDEMSQITAEISRDVEEMIGAVHSTSGATPTEATQDARLRKASKRAEALAKQSEVESEEVLKQFRLAMAAKIED